MKCNTPELMKVIVARFCGFGDIVGLILLNGVCKRNSKSCQCRVKQCQVSKCIFDVQQISYNCIFS